MNKKILTIIVISLLSKNIYAMDFMDGNWAQNLCTAWNETDVLYNKLGYQWVKNNNRRDYRMIRLYRSKCNSNSAVQLIIKPKFGRAVCTYGGNADTTPVDLSVDYVLSANDEDWQCIGKGLPGCRVSGAMSTGKIKLQGDRKSAMKNVDSFNAFLRLTGTISGKKEYCHYNDIIPLKPPNTENNR